MRDKKNNEKQKVLTMFHVFDDCRGVMRADALQKFLSVVLSPSPESLQASLIGAELSRVDSRQSSPRSEFDPASLRCTIVRQD
jgi:hypothetical protein